MLLAILSTIVVLGALIFVHELGHFIFAKLFNVGVEKFSLGFGPKLIGKKIGETEYLISSFPIGGYVKMIGENDEGELSPEDKERSFAEKPPLQRIAIVVAGPLFNLVFACFIFIVVYMVGVPTVTARIGEVVEGKPAARAGIKGGDHITSVNGKPVSRWEDFAKVIAESKGERLTIQVIRGVTPMSFSVVPESRTGKNLFGESVTSPMIGVVASGETVIERVGPLDAVVKGISQTWLYIKITVLSLVKIIERAVSAETIGGPIMIAVLSGQQAAAGAVSFFAFMALLSINLGVLNLLPIPILDGGHLFFYLYEVLFRKPVSQKVKGMAQQIGLVLLISLMFFATYNDISRYWNDIVKFFNAALHGFGK